jgi:RimJ/RimL family protein N-acetyltransferase
MREKDGILVRPFALNDAPAFHASVRESLNELSYWMPWCHPDYSLQDAEQWMRHCEASWQNRSEFPLGIFELASGKVIGGTGINQLNPIYKIGNLGYWVGTPFTGRGVARAAALMAADIGFNDLGLTRLEIVVLTHNLASQRVAEAVGARKECIARNRLYFQGRPSDAFVYSLIPEDLVRETSSL